MLKHLVTGLVTGLVIELLDHSADSAAIMYAGVQGLHSLAFLAGPRWNIIYLHADPVAG